MAATKSTTTTKKTAAKKPAGAKATPDKATGAHIPPPPPTAGGERIAGPAEAGFSGEPGSTLNPSDPAAPNYVFQPTGADTASALEEMDKGTGVQHPTPVFGGAENTDDPDVEWVDEQVALGRRVAVHRKGDRDANVASTTHEEVLPSNATAQQVAAAKERLRTRLIAA